MEVVVVRVCPLCAHAGVSVLHSFAALALVCFAWHRAPVSCEHTRVLAVFPCTFLCQR